jgi:tRNA A-37 threonylcarbamoyl transferase component Bud32
MRDPMLERGGQVHEHSTTDEEALTGGNASASVVRIGDTVRKPWLPTTEHTVAYMSALRDRGIDLPEVRGRDGEGRLVLEYVPGEIVLDRSPLDASLLHRIGALVRSIHDASADLPVPEGWEVLLPAENPNLLCHNDLATWNLISDGERLVFIDWDGAGPSTRMWDLAYAATSFGHLFADEDPEAAGARLAAFVDGYDADKALRDALPATMAHRAMAMHDLLRRSHRSGHEPWGSMYVEGHGEHWDRTAAFIARHEQVWHHALA